MIGRARAMADVLRRAVDDDRLKEAAREAKEHVSGLRKIAASAFEFHRALARLNTDEVRAAIRIAEAIHAELARAADAGMDPEAVLWEARRIVEEEGGPSLLGVVRRIVAEAMEGGR